MAKEEEEEEVLYSSSGSTGLIIELHCTTLQRGGSRPGEPTWATLCTLLQPTTSMPNAKCQLSNAWCPVPLFSWNFLKFPDNFQNATKSSGSPHFMTMMMATAAGAMLAQFLLQGNQKIGFFAIFPSFLLEEFKKNSVQWLREQQQQGLRWPNFCCRAMLLPYLLRLCSTADYCQTIIIYI